MKSPFELLLNHYLKVRNSEEGFSNNADKQTLNRIWHGNVIPSLKT